MHDLTGDAARVRAATKEQGKGSLANITGTNGPETLYDTGAADRIYGLGDDTLLQGYDGQDQLFGDSGADLRLMGGSGDDVVIERSGKGTDLVRAEVDYTLPDDPTTGFVENLRLQGGFGNIDGGGNDLDNVVEGNSGDNRLFGRQGDDRIEGGEDKLVFETGLEVGTFDYIAGQAFSASGHSEARFAGAGLVEVDQDGNGSSDVSFQLAGMSLAGQITATDFLWL